MTCGGKLLFVGLLSFGLVYVYRQSYFHRVQCYWPRLNIFATECCPTGLEMKSNIAALNAALKKKLHGQHLVTPAVINLLHSHLSTENPKKALALSFHGWTGHGKTFVSQMIIQHIYKAGIKSNFVHRFMSPLHFPHKERVREYKELLRQRISKNVHMCKRSMFIFDEIDKMPNGMLDAIKQYLDYYDNIDGIDYRKSIFIFISNSAGVQMNKCVINYAKAGLQREAITHKEMDEIIKLNAFDEAGGLWHSSVMEHNLISAFVPFLPLERRHIRQCVIDDMKSKGIYKYYKCAPEVIERVIDELPFEDDIFCKTGCKRVPDKVDIISGHFQDEL